MKADFIAAAQVLICVGGILVLIIFAVMLTHRITDVKLSNDSTPGPAAFSVLCACSSRSSSSSSHGEVALTRTSRRHARGRAACASTPADEGPRASPAEGQPSRTRSSGVAVVSRPNQKPKRSSSRLAGRTQVQTKSVPVAGPTATFHLLDEGDWQSATLKGTTGRQGWSGARWTSSSGPTVSGAPTEPSPWRWRVRTCSRSGGLGAAPGRLVGAAFLARKEVREA
jgi:hypothetical protein